MTPVAALYTDVRRGPYAHMTGVDAWGLPRDARDYVGPHPVIAHPPCGWWGNFAWNCQQPESWRECGPRAVEQVQKWGGVLEHPAYSRLFKHCNLPRPGDPPFFRRWTLQVDQCWFGHKARKRTWLYIVGVDPRDVVIPEEWKARKATHAMGTSLAKGRTLPCLPKSQRHLTPPAFAEWLAGIARMCR